MSKVSVDSGLLAALVAGFTLSLQRESADAAKISAEEAQISSLTDQLAATNHTVADVQAKLADLQNSIPSDPDPALISQINTLLGTPDTTGAGSSPAAPTALPGVGTSGSPTTGNTNTGGTPGTNQDTSGAPTSQPDPTAGAGSGAAGQ